MFLKNEPEEAFSDGSGSLSARMAETTARMPAGLKSVKLLSAM